MPKVVFPASLYITREPNGYYSVQETPQDTAFEETTICARYDLAELGRVVVHRAFAEADESKEFKPLNLKSKRK